MKDVIAALSTALVLALTACSSPTPVQDGPTGDSARSSSTAPSATPTAAALPAGKFKLTTKSGAEITFTLPTPATDPSVADFEAYRAEVGGAPVSYLVADVDNRKGTAFVNMYRVDAFDAEGKKYSFSTVTDALDKWRPSYSEGNKYTLPNGKVLEGEAGRTLYNRAGDLNNANIHGAEIAERTTIILASADTGLPKEFTRVAVQPSGMGAGEEATPTS